jgi:hypothetical protein
MEVRVMEGNYYVIVVAPGSRVTSTVAAQVHEDAIEKVMRANALSFAVYADSVFLEGGGFKRLCYLVCDGSTFDYLLPEEVGL